MGGRAAFELPSLSAVTGRRLLLVDVVLMLVVALAAICPRLQLAADYDEPPQSEERLYNRYAVPWSRGEGAEPREKAFDWHPLGSFTHRPPGYGLFLGAHYRLAGVENFAAVRRSQAWIDTASMLLVYVCSVLMFGGLIGRAVGLTAGLATSQYDFVMLFVARLLSETLFLFLSLLFLAIALLAARRDSPWASFAAAYVLGWANLVRTFLLFALPGYLIWFVFAPNVTRRRRHVVAAALGMFLAIGPVTIRNWQFHHQFILVSTNSGFTLYHGLSQVEGLSAPEELGTEEEVKALELGEVAEQGEFRSRAVRYLLAHPEDWPKVLERRVRVLLAAKGGHKISHVLMVTPHDEWFYPLVFLGALLSIVVRPRFAWHPRLLVGVLISSQVAVSLLANAEARYRVPLVPLLAILAAWALWGSLWLAVERLGRLRDGERPAESGAGG